MIAINVIACEGLQIHVAVIVVELLWCVCVCVTDVGVVHTFLSFHVMSFSSHA